jgi:hypothetical protein
VSQSEPTSVVLDAKEDLTTRCVTVNFDAGAPVSAEEVIHYLESEGLARRTRTMVNYSIAKLCDKGVSICVHFKCTLDWFFREDIIDALNRFFSLRGSTACA